MSHFASQSIDTNTTAVKCFKQVLGAVVDRAYADDDDLLSSRLGLRMYLCVGMIDFYGC